MKGAVKIFSLALFLSIAGIALLSFFVPFPLVHAQVQINTSIPGSNDTSNPIADSPSAFIANFYQYALAVAGILAFGIIVYGGVRYMMSAGNPSARTDAKEWIEAALLGILLLAGAYLILYIINPNIVSLNLPGLQSAGIITGSATGGSGTTSGGSSGNPNARCQPPPNGPCDLSNISQYSCLGNNPSLAGGVCNVESNGIAAAGGDLASNGQPASVGLFQINLSANTIQNAQGQTLNCPSAFSNPYTGSNPHTTITNPSLYQQCVAAAENPALNIAKACQLSKNGTNWSLWGPATRQACGV